MTTDPFRLTGRTWVFGDHVNTDLMYPGASFSATPEERRALVFSMNRPGWSALVREGDVLVAGINFGTGSGRPGAQLLRELGIGGVVAESINGLFFRSCVNYALPAMECPGVGALVTEGDVVDVDFLAGTVVNTASGARLENGSRIPSGLTEVIRVGGLLPHLEAAGYVEAELPT
ncbi:3-isopropylmalate dehydratase [Pseudonocardia sp. GCM10023141]|uniref:3-isopropylmalate dehydratase n=1 Tax=Pseudonocardia sp. GCM10023141 TaxID=3252653 RepID=UPI003613E8B0